MGYCKEMVYDRSGWGRKHRCTRKAVTDGYCKQHHPDSVKERERKSWERYERERQNSPYAKLQKAHDKIALYESWMKRTEIGKNTIWDLICREYPYLKED